MPGTFVGVSCIAGYVFAGYASILTDGTTDMRWVERDGYMCMDLTLTPLGFDGIKDTDWECVETIDIWGPYSSILYRVDDLVYRTIGRSGNKLTASIGSDADILLPYYLKGSTAGSAGAYVDDPDSDFDIGSSDFTVCGWVQAASTTKPGAGDIYRLLGKGYGTTQGKYGWIVNDAGNFSFEYRTTLSGNQWGVDSGVNAMDQSWHFLLVRIDVTSKIVQHYIDGNKIGNDLNYTGTWPLMTDIQFKLGNTPNSNEKNAPFNFSDVCVYHKRVSDSEMVTLYNQGIVTGAEAHFSGIDPTGTTIYDFSGNDHHLTVIGSGTSRVGYGLYGSRQGLDVGYAEYSDTLTLRIHVPNKDDGTKLTYGAVGHYEVRNFAGDAAYHNLFNSYIVIPDSNFDRSDIAIWSNDIRADYYDASDPHKWHISELHRFNLYYSANSGYEGICFVKKYPNSFALNEYLSDIISYNTNKNAYELKAIYLYTGDYEAEMVYDGDFADSLSANIYKHTFGHYTFTGEKANYDGLDTGCLRQYLVKKFIVGRKYRLRYTISDAANNAYIWITGNSGVHFQEYSPALWAEKANGEHDEELTCIWNGDDFFEIQAGVTGDVPPLGGAFSLDDLSLTIVEDI